ncbi:hypothetical protein NPIL_531341, partial [Nephila pilipes]
IISNSVLFGADDKVMSATGSNFPGLERALQKAPECVWL